ncbi:MAG: universal stress protein [Candidatus Cloacimonetes bacterium]|nr:universal stress protein [Candidatus Cloacimonadota bacterium]
MRRILVAIDFLDTTNKVINFAKDLTKELEAELLIVHSEAIESYINMITTELHQQPSIELIEIQKKQIKKKLKKIHDSLAQDEIKVKCILMEGPTIDNILKETEIFKADLIIVGSHKHGKFYHLLMGSIHNSLISQSPIPVLVIPPEKK